MTVTLPDVSEFQSPASGNAPNWAGIKSQNGGAAIIRVGYGNAHRDGMLGSNRATITSLKFGFCGGRAPTARPVPTGRTGAAAVSAIRPSTTALSPACRILAGIPRLARACFSRCNWATIAYNLGA